MINADDVVLRGAEAYWHRAQTALAAWARALVAAALLGILALLIAFWIITDSGQRTVVKANLVARLWTIVSPNAKVHLTTPEGKTYTLPARDMVALTSPALVRIFWVILIPGAVGVGSAVVGWRAITRKYRVRGEADSENKFLRGQRLKPAAEISNITRPLSKSGFSIGGVPIPDNLLMRNFAFVGVMGSGKTQGIFGLADAARQSGVRAVIYDISGEFIERYYRPNLGDVILNPLDARCAEWDVFSDIASEIDFTTLAQYFVPANHAESNPVFTNAARLALEDAFKCAALGGIDKTMGAVQRLLLTTELPRLVEMFKRFNLPSAVALNPENIRTAESVRFTLASQVALRYFDLFDKPGKFSLREFLEADRSGWVFISSHPKYHSVLQSYAAAWLEISMLASMSGPVVQDVKTLFFIDEVSSLPRLKSLETTLTLGRKYGIATLLGLQNGAQVDEIYGEKIATTMLDNAQTKCVFRTEDVGTAKKMAEALGKAEIDEASAGQSYGLEAGQWGSSINRRRSELDLVLPSQISTLPDLSAYLKIASAYPVCSVQVPYIERAKICPGHQLTARATSLAAFEARAAAPVADDGAVGEVGYEHDEDGSADSGLGAF